MNGPQWVIIGRVAGGDAEQHSLNREGRISFCYPGV